MAMGVMARYSLPANDRAGSAHGAELLKRRGAADQVEVTVVHADGTSEAVRISTAAAQIIADVLGKVATADEVAILAEDAEISAEDASAILGLARPLVLHRMDIGDLPSRQVGGHRRTRLKDVLTLKQKLDEQQAALDRLADDTEDLMRNHGL